MDDGGDDLEARIAARLARIAQLRTRHRTRHVSVRALVALAGFVLLVPAVPIAVVVPEVGVPLLLAALGVLALEFAWAARALARVVRAWERLRRWYRGASGRARSILWVTAVAVLVAIVWVAGRVHT